MEYVAGPTLRQLIKDELIDLPKAIDYARQIAAALSAAHQTGIVHRDIKPENIVVAKGELIKVLDFGLAKLIKTSEINLPATGSLESIPGVIMGTTAYMSPEQVRGQQVDQRTDIWSLGIILCEMLLGKRPFSGETASDCSASIIKTDPSDAFAEIEKISPALRQIVQKALTKKREERYQTAQELLIDLKNVNRDLELKTALENSTSPNFQRIQTDENQYNPTTALYSQSSEQAHSGTNLNVLSAENTIQKSIRQKVAAAIILLVLISGIAAYLFRLSGTDSVSSIAVLPLVSNNSDPDTEYLSEGISESLISNLSYLQNLKVIARSSSFKFKGQDVDVSKAADALGVQKIITGKITRLGDQLVVSVEMINAADNTQMWGGQYTSQASNLIEMQSEISKEIAQKLHARLTGSHGQSVELHQTVNSQAYELLLKGNFFSNKGGTENRKKAVDYYNQAIMADPNYALAYAELSINYIILVNNSILDPAEFKPKAENAALKALELDERLSMGHYALAQIKRSAWDWETAEREYKRAIELNPNLAKAHSGYSFFLSFRGRHAEALDENKRARELDPLSLTTKVETGNLYYLARQYDQAIEALNKTLELDQNFATAHVYLGYVYTAKGMYQEAIAAYQKAIKLGGNTSSRQIFLGAALAKSGARNQAELILQQLQISKDNVSPGELAILYAVLDKREEAFASLEKAFAARDLQLQYLHVDPAFDSLRSDARFQDLLQRVGFTF
jgi:serine/threonine protein kinase/Tfp pilus assembly protein PilF